MPFPVSCPACGKSFSIADDAYEQKIKGRVVSVKCKQCQALIRVDGTRPLDVARRPSSAPAEPAPAFLVDTPGGSDRELDANQIAIELREGRMTEATLVWREGMSEWTEVGKVPELQPFLKPVSLSVPAPAAVPAPAPQRAEPAKKIRPMQPTLPMGMMAPPSLAARGITLPLNPPAAGRPSAEAAAPAPAPARALADETETRRLPAVDENPPAAPDDGFDALFGPSAAQDDVVTSVAPSPPDAAAARPARGSAPRAASAPMVAPAPSPPAAAARPPSAARRRSRTEAGVGPARLSPAAADTSAAPRCAASPRRRTGRGSAVFRATTVCGAVGVPGAGDRAAPADTSSSIGLPVARAIPGQRPARWLHVSDGAGAARRHARAVDLARPPGSAATSLAPALPGTVPHSLSAAPHRAVA